MRAVALSVCLAAALTAATTARAAETAPAPLSTENGRYSMTPVADGFLRLDTRTGAVSLCKVENGAARCQAAAEERTALESEVDRLTRLNETLKKQSDGYRLPNRQDFDRALDYAEEFMRRMMRIMRDEEPRKNQT